MFRTGKTNSIPSDVEFMSEVDAALHRAGHPFAYTLSAAMGGVLFVLMVWAAFASLDEVTRGQGQVIPSQRVQVIQNLEGGILRDILVQEGQVVDKGDILLRIDNEAAESFYRDAQAKSVEHTLAVARLEAELAGSQPEFPREVAETMPGLVQNQLQIFNARQQQFAVEKRVLESQVTQKRQEVEEMSTRKRQLEESLRVAVEQREIARPLMEKQIYPRVDYLSLEQKVIGLRGDIGSLAINIPRARAAAQEAEERLGFRVAQMRSEALEELNKRRVELASLKETLSAGGDRVTRTDVRSPVRGSVKRVLLNTVGGVVRPGEPIMEVVPIDDTLRIEARVRPADIAFLHPQQKAIVKITAYDYSIYGGLEGEVEQISADTMEDRKGEFYYLVKVRTKKSGIIHRGEVLPIMPGMTASVDILTGKKSVLDYLLKPVLKAKHEAMRER